MIKFELDGVTVEVDRSGSADVSLKVNDNEEVIFSPKAALILALGLQTLAEEEDE